MALLLPPLLLLSLATLLLPTLLKVLSSLEKLQSKSSLSTSTPLLKTDVVAVNDDDAAPLVSVAAAEDDVCAVRIVSVAQGFDFPPISAIVRLFPIRGEGVVTGKIKYFLFSLILL